MTALRELPDLKILEKSLTYLSQMDYSSHDTVVDGLFQMLGTRQLPFPYQIGSVLETIALMHPRESRSVASRTRKYGLLKKQDWSVIQKTLEVIFVYPYKPDNAHRLANKYLASTDPMVRRASCVLLLRSPKTKVRKQLRELIYHPDHNLSLLALYFLRLQQDNPFAQQELSRIRQRKRTDLAMQWALPCLYAMGATEDRTIATSVYDFLYKNFRTRSDKLNWHRHLLLNSLQWTRRSTDAKEGTG
jgi:hypothetical protein